MFRLLILELIFIQNFFSSLAHCNLKTEHSNQFNRRTELPQATFHRLPTNVIPQHYYLTLQPDLDRHVFAGHESVVLQVKELSNEIKLNAHELEIQDVFLTDTRGRVLQPSRVNLNKDEQTMTIKFRNAIQPGIARLNITFSGILNDKLVGFYRSTYIINGEKRTMATTQFEATHARQAFPCWDEPALKATFDVILIVPKDRTALSNMDPIREIEIGSILREVHYATTPKMSTYLLAFIVGELDYVQQLTDDRKVMVRVFTPRTKRDSGLFALDVAVKCLQYYRDYFGVAYPLPKLDMVGIPDFAFGAMENWGLVTYREIALLIDEKSSSARRQSVAIIVAHELAHQWFGNIVTMQWWTHLWLNEGFATFMEYKAIDSIFPDWKVWEQFLSDSGRGYQNALELDSLRSSHPIEVHVEDPKDIRTIFDNISYQKGAAVIRMLNWWVGDENFRKGMNIYLRRHAYNNTETKDLWVALEDASTLPVASVMKMWTSHEGFPLLKYEEIQQGPDRVISLTQSRFTADGQLTPKDMTLLWTIPIQAISASSPFDITSETLMSSRQTSLKVENAFPNEWVKINPGLYGFYRVQYNIKTLENFIDAIQDKTMPPVDRFNIQSDHFAMVQSGRGATVDHLNLLLACRFEDNYAVWRSILGALADINFITSHTNFQPMFHDYARNLLTNIYDQVGWDSKPTDGHLDGLLRNSILSAMGRFKQPSAISEAMNRFNAEQQGRYAISKDMKSVIYRIVGANSDDSTYYRFFEMYNSTNSAEEKRQILGALTSSNDRTRLERVLQFGLSNAVRSQDTSGFITATSRTPVGRELVWQFFKNNVNDLKERYEGGVIISRILKNILNKFASEERAKEIESYFARNPIPGTERSISQSLERIRINAQWLRRDSESMRNFLSRQRYL